MQKKKSTKKLNVYLNGFTLGVLEFKARKELSFTYAVSWLQEGTAFPISRSLPLRETPYEGSKVYAYFDNLLPDVISIRQRMAAQMQAASDHVFDLLAVVGRDCVGALQFLPEDHARPKLEDAHGTDITNSEIAEKLKNLRLMPLAASIEQDFRLSIAGAQEKTAFLWLDNKWKIPHGSTPTTHIFKPQIGELTPGLSFSDSVENEWLCSKIVEAFGLPVAKTEIQMFEDVKVLVVERFDRVWHENLLIRIPQEDLCQALSIPNFIKYENEGGPGIISIMNLLYESSLPEPDRIQFLKSQIIFFLLAAIDGHAKNFSIHWYSSGFQLTPLYDVLSAQPLTDNGKLTEEKIKMAMAVGESRHYRVDSIARRHFFQTAKDCRLDSDEVDILIDQILTQVPEVIQKVSNTLDSSFPKTVSDSIFNGILKRSNRLRVFAPS